jgi:hypothetical protein
MLASAAIRGAPVSPSEPPATSTCPELNLVEDADLRGSRSSTAAVIRPTDAEPGVPLGMPMSIVSTSPACALPGRIHNPGLHAWKVTVTVARTAVVATVPSEASTPLGTSTLTTVAPAALTASIASAAGPCGSPRKPVPSTASTITPPRAKTSVSTVALPEPAAAASCPHAVPSRRTGGSPGRRSRFARASPANSSGAATHTTVTCRPERRSRRATTSPSPPLLPLPHTTVTGPSGAARSTARATPAPARSIRSNPATPRSSIAQRSIARIASASGSGTSQGASGSTTRR